MDQLFNYGGTVEYQDGELDLPGERHLHRPRRTCGPDPLLAAVPGDRPGHRQALRRRLRLAQPHLRHPLPRRGLRHAGLHRGRAEREHHRSAAAPGATPGTGGLGLTVEHPTDHARSLRDLEPAGVRAGQPLRASPTWCRAPRPRSTRPTWTLRTPSATGGTLASGTYEYAVTDQFNGADSPSTDQSQAYVTAAQVTVVAVRATGRCRWCGRRSATRPTTSSTVRRPRTRAGR